VKILITGAAGFIGSHTAKLLEERGHQVLALDNFSTGKTENLKGFRGKIRPGDITDTDSLHDVFYEFRPEAVLHLAAQSAITRSIKDPQHDLKVNGIGTIRVLAAATEFGVGRFVFSSTSAVYKETRPFWNTGISEKWPTCPSSPYGVSKLACEQYIRNSFPNHMIMRYGNVYGPRQVPIGDNLLIARALSHFLLGHDFHVDGHGNQKRDFVYVGDVAECNMEALMTNVVGTFNVASGESHSVNEVLRNIENIYGVPGYQWEHTKNNDPRGDVKLNVSAIRRELGWHAHTSFLDGIVTTSDWWQKRTSH